MTGYDLTRLICGSEGTLALVTKIIVRLLPKPKTRRTLQAIYNRIDDAGKHGGQDHRSRDHPGHAGADGQ